MKTEKIKNIAVCAVFALLVFGLLIVGLLTPDAAVSRSERRKLTQLPELTAKAVFSQRFSEDFESYALDQFAFRESFRTLKAATSYDVFRRLDSNGLYTVDGGLYKIEYPLNEKQISVAAKKFNALREQYFTDQMRVYYAVIPDKSYFTAASHGYPSMDYARLTSLLQSGVQDMTYIDLFDCLTVDDYYATDPHWRQEKLAVAVQRIAGVMGFSGRLTPFSAYERHTVSGFRGVYAGQSALNVPDEDLVYLTSPAIEAATAYNLEKNETLPVYVPAYFDNVDPYDLYLSGAAAYLVIENPNAATDKELILFRDSFGSSIAPLLLEGYAKVTLVDLRYMSSQLLGQLIDFTDQDVLFLYCTSVLNNASLLR